MFIKDFLIKPSLISFYKTEHKYRVLNERYKKEKLIFSETKEFDSKKELKSYIKEVTEDNPQTYVSTCVLSPNQGVFPSCNKQKYKEAGIEIENIKYICINNKYSFYITLYELMEHKKSYDPDFLYSVLSLMDKKASLKHNILYALVIKEYYYFIIYKENIPVFSDIFEVQEESFEETEEIEDISDLDIVEDFDTALDDNIENIEDEEIEKEHPLSTMDIEYKVLEYIKTSLKEYYEGGGDFIEKIIILDTVGLEKDLTKSVQEELFIDSEIKKFDILKTMNEMSRENV